MLSNRSCPDAIVIPEVPYPDVIEAQRWLCAAFGFSLRVGIGGHRAQLNVPGGGAVVLTEKRTETTASVMVRVEDAAAHCERAVAEGARLVHPVTDYPYGERQYTVLDLAGNQWKFTQTIADVNLADWGGEAGVL